MASIPRRQLDENFSVLHNGDRLKQHEFHLCYSRMPENYRAELIGGIVYEPSPVSYFHGKHHIRLGFLLETYSIETPNTEVADNATVILSEEDEVQPDLTLLITSAHGGQSRLSKEGYVEGPPELVAEIAYSSRAIDLHLKKERYALAGVLEYIVVCLQPKKVYWFDLKEKRTLTADTHGVLRSSIFPGLWIHEDGLLQDNRRLTLKVIKQGLLSAEHAEFVGRNR